MDTLTARPEILKQANLSLIRNLIKSKRTATRTELAEETGISSTTVRSLLNEMLENGEIESIGCDASTGGRKAERYQLRPEHCYGISFCIRDQKIHCLLINTYGEIVETSLLTTSGYDYETPLISYLDELISHKEIRAVGIGIPGVVDGHSYWKRDENSGEMYQVNLGSKIENRYDIPVILENDLNAITIGFDRCYHKEFPSESRQVATLAYVHFDVGCISAGFVSGGKIIRGCHNYAGELGLLPADNDKLLGQQLLEATDDNVYVNQIIQILTWICGILNPQYIALAGPALRQHCIGPIGDGLYGLLPDPMLAEIVYSPDVWQDYHMGMAYLTSTKMFGSVQFIKE